MDWPYHLISVGIICESIVSFYIAFFLYRQYRQNKLRIILLWSASFICLGLAVLFILTGISYQMFFGVDKEVLMFCFRFGIICLVLMGFFSGIFIIYIEYGAIKARLPLLVIASMLAGLLMGSILSPSMFWVHEYDFPPLTFISMRYPVLDIGGIFLLYFAILYIKVFGRMVRENKGTGLQKKLKKILWGLLIHTLGLLVCQVWGILANNLYINFLYPYVGTVGLLIYVQGLKDNPKYLIYLKQKVYRLIVFQRGGEVLYIYRFHPWPAKEEMYVVSSLTGVGSFLQSTLGLSPEANFDTIEVTDTKILCEFKGNLGFALIVSADSPILREALRHIVEKFAVTKVFDDRFNFTFDEFENSVLPILNAIVEDIFFFYPEKELRA